MAGYFLIMPDIYILILLCVVAFAAGFVDAVAGGGGLLQTPAALVLLPHYAVSTIIGSLKIPAFCGTAFAAAQYSQKVKLNWRLLSIMAALAFLAAFAGSTLMTMVSNDFMKPLLLGVLISLAIYTFSKKNLGQHQEKEHTQKNRIWYAILISMSIGFYDGFIGPGTGSFLVMAFIMVLGFDFLHASANAKLVNMATNLGSITLFIIKGKIIWSIALPMAFCNAVGGWLGARTAIRRGNNFIRIFFLIVVTGTLLRLGYDVFFN